MNSLNPIRNNDAENRYELAVEGHVAIADYSLSGNVITFTHTVVPAALEGRGVGSQLIKGALAEVRAKGLKVVAQCAFVAAYIDRHPEERDVLAGG